MCAFIKLGSPTSSKPQICETIWLAVHTLFAFTASKCNSLLSVTVKREVFPLTLTIFRDASTQIGRPGPIKRDLVWHACTWGLDHAGPCWFALLRTRRPRCRTRSPVGCRVACGPAGPSRDKANSKAGYNHWPGYL